MKNLSKYLIIYICLLGALIGMAINLAQAQTPEITEVEVVEEVVLEQAELDQLLAPIALYPDTLLSHILVASTYPLEVIQAKRWREDNEHLSEDEVLQVVEGKEWDPSVKAIAPFLELTRLTDDLEWLQQLGDAFLHSEEQVLASVQALRQKARDHGNLEDNEYIEVVEEDSDIVIQPVEREVVYVPYYDTRVVYGHWWWDDYPPIYWSHPRHYVWHAGFHWSPRFHIHNRFFFGGFHWQRRYVVVNHHHYYNPRPVYHEQRRVRVREYQRWQHNPIHRRGVRYPSGKTVYAHNKKRVLTAESQKLAVARKHAMHKTIQPLVRNQQVKRYDKTYDNLRSERTAQEAKKIRSHNKAKPIQSGSYRVLQNAKKPARPDYQRQVTNTTKPTENARVSKPQRPNQSFRSEVYGKERRQSADYNRRPTQSYQSKPSNKVYSRSNQSSSRSATVSRPSSKPSRSVNKSRPVSSGSKNTSRRNKEH